MHKHFVKAKEEGITYIELLISMAIVSVGIAAASGMFLTGVHGDNFSNSMSTAITLSQDAMEVIKNTTYKDIAGYQQDYGSISGYSNFKRVVAVTADSPEANMKSVTITVSWMGSDREHKVTFRSIVAMR